MVVAAPRRVRARVGAVPLAAAFAIALISLATFSVSAQTAPYLPLVEFAAQRGIVVQWDHIRGAARLRRGDTVVELVPGIDVAAVNFRRIVRIAPIILDDGQLLISPSAAERVAGLFPPQSEPGAGHTAGTDTGTSGQADDDSGEDVDGGTVPGSTADGDVATTGQSDADTDIDDDAPVDGRRIDVIFIDPGHGGRDPGAVGEHEVDGETLTLYEKDIALRVGLLLRDFLVERFPNRRIVMSRDDDTLPTLAERTELANAQELAENEHIVFVSIHANASLTNPDAGGFEVWYLPPEYRRDLLADYEDDLSPSVRTILNAILEEEFTVESLILAQSVLAGLDAKVGDLSPNRGVKQEEWYVVTRSRMPAVLVELGFVTQIDEFLRLRSDDYLRKLAEGIYSGIVAFIEDYESVYREAPP